MPGTANKPKASDTPTETTPCPAIVLDKVRHFNEHLAVYQSGDYSEAQLRVDFINPMLEALGWDVENKNGYAEAYRDVVYEDAVKVGGTSKAPDYGFYIGGRAAGGGRKFFLEAKRPSVAIRVDPKPAFQLRRYAWTAGLPLSILTNFREFLVFDTRIKPHEKDSATAAVILRLQHTDYPQRWHEIASVFSRDAILRGSFDKFAQAKRKKGMEPLGEAFLSDIEEWRKMLAREIADHNPQLTSDELNFAVQRTIDRIIFLRICEDRGIEPVGHLLGVTNGDKIYARLGKLFRDADDRYNSGIFHFPAAGRKPDPDRTEPPDDLTLDLTIEDRPLKKIIRGLYDPCPYEFSVIPPEILGQVYEQFLGQVIVKTPKTVRIEPKPEVRKADGVYYTPAYIVDYIVKNTVGKLLDSKTPEDAAKLRILDPASGSGSFLIGAYQHLLDWHLRWYLDNEPDSHCTGKNPPLMRVMRTNGDSAPGRVAPAAWPARPGSRAASVDYRLTTHKRKEILLKSIYGVDIDPQAVEVTKLSLLLKVLEGESQESVNAQLRIFHQRALPDLGRNIKCGNSLIGDDFDDNDIPEKVRKKINKFNWQPAFPLIFKTGGFDAVIGNPPYVRMELFKPVKDYLQAHYRSHEERADLYTYFVERGLRLLNERGLFGMIVSNKFIKAKYGRPLRSVIDDRAKVERLTDLAGANVFHGATVRTIILIMRPKAFPGEVTTTYSPVPPSPTMDAIETARITLDSIVADTSYVLPSSALSVGDWRTSGADESAMIDRLRKDAVPLRDYLQATALFGAKTGLNDAFIIDAAKRLAMIQSDSRVTKHLKPILFGRDIRRYAVEDDGRYVIYFPPEEDATPSTAIRRHLKPFRRQLEARAGKQEWYQLQQPAVGLLQYQRKPKIVYPIIANECRFALDRDGYLINDKAFILPTDDLVVLGILNSRVANFYFSVVCAALEGKDGKYLEFRAQYVDLFPMPRRDKAKHDRMMKLVDRMLALHKQLAAVKTPHDKERLPREIVATDRQIDKLVYELYGLTDEEIRIVEEATE